MAISHISGAACQFPFIFKGETYTSCTSVMDDKPWCATKVDQFNQYIGPHWEHCSAECPGDDGPDACPVRTTGFPFPDSCADRLSRSNKNILFIGNSYTYGNNLPGMVANIASAAGKDEDDIHDMVPCICRKECHYHHGC